MQPEKKAIRLGVVRFISGKSPWQENGKIKTGLRQKDCIFSQVIFFF
jgi:hypothetical protein